MLKTTVTELLGTFKSTWRCSSNYVVSLGYFFSQMNMYWFRDQYWVGLELTFLQKRVLKIFGPLSNHSTEEASIFHWQIRLHKGRYPKYYSLPWYHNIHKNPTQTTNIDHFSTKITAHQTQFHSLTRLTDRHHIQFVV